MIDLQAGWDYLEQHPEGVRQGEFIRVIGSRSNHAGSVLTKFEREGYLISEDERGRLYPFGRRNERI